MNPRSVATVPVLNTARLTLRDWRDEDLAPFAALNADPRVMEYFPAPLSRAESDALASRIRAHLRSGLGLWAVERNDTREFCGYVGLARPSFEAHFTPCTEIGWRLAYAHQGQGFATEAALACIRHAFENSALDEIVSFTATINRPSRRVMEKIGMLRDPREDFDHPRVADGSPLRRHVLYRLPAPQAGSVYSTS